MTIKPNSSSILILGAVVLMTMGIYFIFLRPPLLHEDLRYMNLALLDVSNTIPGLESWLRKVFWVLGGYIFATGLLTAFIASTSFRRRESGAFSIVALSGITSIGIMTMVNFMIDSDFKWVLLAFILPWAIALILYRYYK